MGFPWLDPNLQPAGDIFLAEIRSVGANVTDIGGNVVTPYGWRELILDPSLLVYVDHPMGREGASGPAPDGNPAFVVDLNCGCFNVGDYVWLRIRGATTTYTDYVYDIIGSACAPCTPWGADPDPPNPSPNPIPIPGPGGKCPNCCYSVWWWEQHLGGYVPCWSSSCTENGTSFPGPLLGCDHSQKKPYRPSVYEIVHPPSSLNPCGWTLCPLPPPLPPMPPPESGITPPVTQPMPPPWPPIPPVPIPIPPILPNPIPWPPGGGGGGGVGGIPPWPPIPPVPIPIPPGGGVGGIPPWPPIPPMPIPVPFGGGAIRGGVTPVFKDPRFQQQWGITPAGGILYPWTGSVVPEQIISSSGSAGNTLIQQSDGTFASSSAASGASTYVGKTAETQTVNNSTTLVNDDALSFTMDANGIYDIELVVLVTTDGTAGFKYRVTGPAAPTRIFRNISNGYTGATSAWMTAIEAFDTSDNSISTGPGAASIILTESWVVENGANSGTFQFKWAQNSSAVTDTIVRKPSYIRYKKR